jgi:hypothetical protein
MVPVQRYFVIVKVRYCFRHALGRGCHKVRTAINHGNGGRRKLLTALNCIHESGMIASQDDVRLLSIVYNN